MVIAIQYVKSNWIWLIAAYFLIASYTFGHAYNHACDGRSHDPKTMFDKWSSYEWCMKFVGPGPFVKGTIWPIYWTGSFFIWWHEGPTR